MEMEDQLTGDLCVLRSMDYMCEVVCIFRVQFTDDDDVHVQRRG
jgi:hypothetical protein